MSNIHHKFELILGSQSPRRKELLSWLGLPYKILTADLEEISDKSNPVEIALDLASQKAQAVFKKLSEVKFPFVISSDTIVVLDNKIYGKPKNLFEAKEILSHLSGRTHQVITGMSFLYKNLNHPDILEHQFFDSTDVTFNEITPDLMSNYLATKDSLDKAGAYGIQGPSLTFISSVQGSYSNVVGFPLDKTVLELKKILGPEWRQFF